MHVCILPVIHIYKYIYIYLYIYIYIYIYSVAYRTAAFLLMAIAGPPQGLAGLMELPKVPPPIMDCGFCGKLNMPRVEWTVHLYTQHN